MAVGVAGEILAEQLEGDLALEGELPGEVDLAHAAGADLAEDFELAERPAGEVGAGRIDRRGSAARHPREVRREVRFR